MGTLAGASSASAGGGSTDGQAAVEPGSAACDRTGLACGNSCNEALLRALFEVVERDMLYRDGHSGIRLPALIAPGTVDDLHGSRSCYSRRRFRW
ncbi:MULTISPECIES: YcaO-like family protein [unclassified Streptomyces]|uniref:YcaO-like family protein n=1 Tax=unclassified Streptomyces TaxID=2593676 RepID=UPI0029BB2556|nr:YcaO-like family protein [Streptomyces sp. PA03-2a]MDX2733438.1 YcaO-like family protein [Streptomyces sp. PA03-2a]